MFFPPFLPFAPGTLLVHLSGNHLYCSPQVPLIFLILVIGFLLSIPLSFAHEDGALRPLAPGV